VAFVYWVFASLIFALTAESGSFLDQFLNPGFNEVLSRLLALCFFMIFGSHVGYTIRQRQKAYEAFAGSEEKYRTIIENIETAISKWIATVSSRFSMILSARLPDMRRTSCSSWIIDGS
jgi:hypothetical protein